MELIGSIIDIENVYVAKITEDSANAFTTSAPEWLAKAAEIKNDIKTSKKVVYAEDGEPAINFFSEDGDITVTILGVSDKKAAELVGKSYDSTKGAVFDSGKLDHVPMYALGYRQKAGEASMNGGTYYKYRWFLKGQFSMTDPGAKAPSPDVDPQNQELTYAPMRTTHQFTFPDPSDYSETITDGLKVVKTDTTDPAFTTESSWFSQVQTPSTFGAPSAIAMSSIVPVANATSVAVSASVVITFNNQIASHNVTLVDNVTGALVASAITFNSAGKVMTIKPSSNMTSAHKHLVMIVGVTDIFGQTLPNAISAFTTA